MASWTLAATERVRATGSLDSVVVASVEVDEVGWVQLAIAKHPLNVSADKAAKCRLFME
jgi:hypothetical protein